MRGMQTIHIFLKRNELTLWLLALKEEPASLEDRFYLPLSSLSEQYSWVATHTEASKKRIQR